MPWGAGAVVVLDRCEAVDDTGSGGVSACDGVLDSGDPPTAGGVAAGESATARVMVVAQHERQQGPVHLVVVLVAGSGMNRDEVGGVGEVSVQARVVAAGYLGRVVVEFLVALLRAQNVRSEGVHVGPGGTDQRKPLCRRDWGSGYDPTLGSV
jgi:hypothetical protein